MNDILDKWDEYSDEIMQRLAAGDIEYKHDPAEKKPTAVLIAEIKEELCDIPAWSLFLRMRIEALEDALEELERRRTHLSKTPI